MSDIFISIVSHGQGKLANLVLADIKSQCAKESVVVTSNIVEPDPLHLGLFPRATHIDNPLPKGFGANHNAAFRHCQSPFFCVSNPDIRIPKNPFERLLAVFDDPKVGLVAPLILNSDGGIEDSVRYFPTPARIVGKALGLSQGRFPLRGSDTQSVDWVAGMFMLFRSQAFIDVGGFDEGFFLYYEDVDICARLRKAGWKVIVHPGSSVVHDAQRTSRRNLRYMRWHLSSMLRYFSKHFRA
jgi:N-acetylglucosaminyl-diphospho-decaprenol L-rhamnosyltransferase